MPTVTMHAWHLAILAVLVVALAGVAVWSYRRSKAEAARVGREMRRAYTAERQARTAERWHHDTADHLARAWKHNSDLHAWITDAVPHLPTSGAGPKLRRRASDLLP